MIPPVSIAWKMIVPIPSRCWNLIQEIGNLKTPAKRRKNAVWLAENRLQVDQSKPRGMALRWEWGDWEKCHGGGADAEI